MTVTINGTTGIAGVDGSASTPAAQGADTNTGIFYGTDIVGVSTGGTERVRVDASGNVGIGSASQESNRLAIYGTTPSVSLTDTAATGNNGNTYLKSYKPGTGWNTLNFGAHSYTWSLDGSGTPAMTFDSSGNLLVGNTGASPFGSCRIAVDTSNEGMRMRNTSSSGASSATMIRFLSAANATVGSITATGTATSYATSSDYRLKENIQPMQNALAVVQQLNPVTYTWKADGSDGQGFIAHELQAVVPDCVTGEKDAVDAEGNPVYQGIDTSFLVATLTKAIQELTARVEQLEAK